VRSLARRASSSPTSRGCPARRQSQRNVQATLEKEPIRHSAQAHQARTANLPATPTTNTATTASPLSSQITVYDSLGTAHSVTLNWSQTPDPASTTVPQGVLPNQWTVQISVPQAVATVPPTAGVTDPTDAGKAQVTFGPSTATGGDPTALPGTIGNIVAGDAAAADPGTIKPSSYPATASSTPATLSFVTNFGSGNQPINLNLGTYGGTSGVTQFAGSAYSLLGLTQDGVAPGSFSGVTTQNNGNIIVNYNNGQTRTIAQVPLVTFNAPDALQSQNGQSFTATPGSGTPLAEAASSNGAGNLVTGSVEGSNVDIATEFTNLIVSQQAYSSNAKVVTTANTMLQVSLQMVV
jgi:flagellar hook protein FlgE